MPTLFGVVNLRFKLSNDGKVLHVSFTKDWREEPRRIILHVPPVAELSHVFINGRRYSAKNPIELETI
jgi:hypothetical protein